VVAGTTKVLCAVLIRIPEQKQTYMRRILADVYQKCLKWAYTAALASNNPETIIPEFQEDVASSKSFPMTKDCVVFSMIIWKSC